MTWKGYFPARLAFSGEFINQQTHTKSKDLYLGQGRAMMQLSNFLRSVQRQKITLKQVQFVECCQQYSGDPNTGHL